MAESDLAAEELVRMDLAEIRLDTRGMCGVRFIPSVSFAFEDSVHVYRAYHRSIDRDKNLRCTEADLTRWAAAERTYLDTLSRAVEALYRAHGGRSITVDLYEHRARWDRLGRPVPLPGWRRRATVRSEDAQRAFLAATEPATKAYRSVRVEIAQRISDLKAEEQAEIASRAREAEQRREVALQFADQPVWNYTSRAAETNAKPGAILVYRCDVTPLPASPAESEEPLTARQLYSKLRELGLHPRSGKLKWDARARARVRKECRDAGAPMTFTDWWAAVATEMWTPPAPRPRTRRRRTTPHTTPRANSRSGSHDGSSSGGGNTSDHGASNSDIAVGIAIDYITSHGGGSSGGGGGGGGGGFSGGGDFGGGGGGGGGW
ncbi:hypothetical protein [Streptomyces paludis]|uniref:hypothetical protein n=1 Tax=Streptomyces paludis TaxID=2282738 RepID=UPI001E2E8C8F|nr:hypothetical protein [Streptomyces paludis]